MFASSPLFYRYLNWERMCVRSVQAAVALRRGVDLVGLPGGGTGCPQGVGLVRVSIGLVYRRPAALGGRTADDLAEEYGSC
jgi:hypothetical protein